MNSYPPTTLLPPSPSRWCPYTVDLPESDENLLSMCLLIDEYLDRLWTSYLTYCEFVRKPESKKIFNVIFSEMDFFEIIKNRAIDKMSSSISLRELYD